MCKLAAVAICVPMCVYANAYVCVRAQDENLFTKKALDASFDEFVLDEADLVWVELARALVARFPELDVNVRSKLVPGRS